MAQQPVHLRDPAFIALQQSRTHLRRRSPQRRLTPHLLSPNGDEHPVFAFIQKTRRKGEERITGEAQRCPVPQPFWKAFKLGKHPSSKTIKRRRKLRSLA